MTPHAFSEDQLCERPALQVLGSLGWQTASAAYEIFGPSGTFGRETPTEAVLIPRLWTRDSPGPTHPRFTRARCRPYSSMFYEHFPNVA